MAFIRQFKSGKNGTAIQVLFKEHGEIVKTIHVGSATSEKGIAKLRKKAEEIIHEGQGTLFNLDDFDQNLAKNRKN